jgi:hypothetical protein
VGRQCNLHSLGRVPSFFSSRRNWNSPECASVPPPPPVLGGGAHSLAREGLRESQFRRGDIHCGTLYIFVLCVVVTEAKLRENLSSLAP